MVKKYYLRPFWKNFFVTQPSMTTFNISFWLFLWGKLTNHFLRVKLNPAVSPDYHLHFAVLRTKITCLRKKSLFMMRGFWKTFFAESFPFPRDCGVLKKLIGVVFFHIFVAPCHSAAALFFFCWCLNSFSLI